MTQHTFYLLTEFFVSLIGSLLLFSIWYTVQNQFKTQFTHEISVKRIDKGLLYLSLSVLVWAFSALFTIFTNQIDEWLLILMQNILSILNSSFIIMALFYFDNAPNYLYNNKKSTRIIILGIIGISVLSFVIAVFSTDSISKLDIRLSSIPDLILSITLSWFLVISLYKTFKARGMMLVAYTSCLAIVLMVVSQLPQTFHFNDMASYGDLIKIVAKSALISIFLVLGTSWVIELSQIANVSYMKIHFTDWNQLTVSIPSKGITNQIVEFGSKTTQFNNLLKFAIRRKFANEKDMCIEIILGGEIQSQTYLSRIIDNFNDILALKDNDKLSRNDLFTFIGQGKYRLRFIPKYIEIDEALLNEFVQNTNHSTYSNFVK